jgi:medium-chain acyl-[acyl-carrier-protein] hydrolase
MNANPWLRLLAKPQANKKNLLCFPFAGGMAEYYLPWQKRLNADWSLCPIQLPGRSTRWQEPVIVSIETLLVQLLDAITPVLYTAPYRLWGHSMGGYIVYQLAKAIVKKGLPLPEALFVSSVPAPIWWQKRRLLSTLSASEFEAFFLELGGFHPDLQKHENFMKMQLTLLRDDIKLCEDCLHEAHADFPFPILAFGAQDDPYVSIESMQAWQDETQQPFQLHAFHGGHFYINQHVDAILAITTRSHYKESLC